MRTELVCVLGERKILERMKHDSFFIWSYRHGDTLVTALSPTNHRELAESLSVCNDIYLFLGQEISKETAEEIVAASVSGKRIHVVDLGVDSSFLKGIEYDVVEVETPEDFSSSPAGNEAKVFVDRFFNVKGVGPVALGFLVSGRISKNDKLIASNHSSTTEVTIKGIQLYGKDMNSVEAPARIGLSFRGKPELGKGWIISSSPVDRHTKGRAVLSEFSSMPKACNAVHGFEWAVYNGELDRPMPLPALLVGEKMPRVFGRLE